MNRGSFDMSIELHDEDGVWWAESNDLRGWSASADSRGELVEVIRDSIAELRPGASWYVYGPAALSLPEEGDKK